MSRTRFIFSIVVFTLFGCEKKNTHSEFEQAVLNEIFLKVVDSTYKDKRIYTSFPDMGEDMYDKNENGSGEI